MLSSVKPFERIARVSYAISALAALACFGALALLEDTQFVVVCTAGVFAFFVGLAYPVWYRSIGRQYDRQVEDLLSGRYWARLRYSSQEWILFKETEWELAKAERLSRLAKPLVVVALTVAFVPICIFLAVPTFQDPSLVGVTGFFAILMLGVVFANRGSPLWAWVQWRLRSRRATGEVYLGPSGIFEPDWFYTPLRAPRITLTTVEMSVGEYPVITFATERLSTVMDGSGLYPNVPRRVLIPADRMNDAIDLVARYKEEFRV